MNPSILSNLSGLNLQSCINLPSLLPLSLLSMDSDIPNLLLMLKLQNSLQAQMLRNSLSHLAKLKEQAPLPVLTPQYKESANSFAPIQLGHLLRETHASPVAPVNQTPQKSVDANTMLRIKSRQTSLNSVESTTQSGQSEFSDSENGHLENKTHAVGVFSFSDDPSICLEAQIKHMVMFFINSYGKLSEEKVQQERKRYASTKALAHVFDTLVVKYASTTKTKEEMVKYILRRAFKSFRKNIKKQTQLDAKGVSTKLCKKYFNASKEELVTKGMDIQDDEDLLKLLLPFRKNSKNKTMNSSFISEIFANEDFKQDYETSYLVEFDQLTEKDNKEKVKRFVSFIEECVKKESYEAIKKYKRIPWLKIWMENTKKVAFEISSQKQVDESPRKMRKADE